jgi:hypothetical protein
MYSRFIKSSKAEDNLQKFMKLKYSGKIDEYLIQILHLNRARKISVPAWKHYLKQGIHHEIWFILNLKTEPAQNEEFIKQI